MLPDHTTVNDPITNNPLPFYMKDCLKGKTSEFPSFRNGHVALVDESNLLADLANIFTNDYNYKVKKYSSVEELEDYTKGSSYDEDVCLGIAVDSFQNN